MSTAVHRLYDVHTTPILCFIPQRREQPPTFVRIGGGGGRRTKLKRDFSHADGGTDGPGSAETEHHPRPVRHEDADALP